MPIFIRDFDILSVLVDLEEEEVGEELAFEVLGLGKSQSFLFCEMGNILIAGLLVLYYIIIFEKWEVHRLMLHLVVILMKLLLVHLPCSARLGILLCSLQLLLHGIFYGSPRFAFGSFRIVIITLLLK